MAAAVPRTVARPPEKIAMKKELRTAPPPIRFAEEVLIPPQRIAGRIETKHSRVKVKQGSALKDSGCHDHGRDEKDEYEDAEGALSRHPAKRTRAYHRDPADAKHRL